MTNNVVQEYIIVFISPSVTMPYNLYFSDSRKNIFKLIELTVEN